MGFQPFGYRFEISSSLLPAEAKAAIRAKKTGILDPKNGARGWVIGPFICLWFSAFDRYGPMLFGLILADGLGTRVRGRAGSDLNGVLMFTLLIPLMAWIVIMMIAEGVASGRQLSVLAFVFLIGGPVIYWFAHRDRKGAEPLVRFLREALALPDVRTRSTSGTRKALEGLRLILNGDYLEGPVTDEATQAALLRVGNRDFLIIESSPQDYLQTALRDGEYILEVRKGGPSKHYQAVKHGRKTGSNGCVEDTFTFKEVCEAIAAYLAGIDMPRFVHWRLMVIQA